VIEDAHLAICHMLAGEVRDRIAQETEKPWEATKQIFAEEIKP